MIPVGRVSDMSSEIGKAWDLGPRWVHQHTLTGDQDLAVFVSLLAFMLNSDLPHTRVLLPCGSHDSGVEVHITFEVPFLRGAFDIILDLSTTGEKPCPIWIGIKWKGLEELGHFPNRAGRVLT